MKSFRYKIYCETDGWRVFDALPGDSPPTVCDVDPLHTIRVGSLSVVEVEGDPPTALADSFTLYAEDLTESGTTAQAASPGVKLSLAHPGGDSALYELRWSATVKASKKVGVRLWNATDSVDVTGQSVVEPEESDEPHAMGGFTVLALDSTPRTFELQWWDASGKYKTAKIANARVLIRRLG